MPRRPNPGNFSKTAFCGMGMVLSLLGCGAAKKRSRRSLRRLAALLLSTGGALAVLAISQGAPPNRVGADLARHDWERLTGSLTRFAPPSAAPSTGPSATPATAAPAATPSFGPEPEEPGRREILVRQAIDYDARRPKTVIELQKFRHSEGAAVIGPGGQKGRAVLVDLNPHINAWYLLQLTWDGGPTTSYHLENVAPARYRLALDPAFPSGLMLLSAQGSEGCDLWSGQDDGSLAAASRREAPFVPLCDERVALRRPTAGRRTHLEWAADFLRDHVWSGEELTVLVRSTLFRDSQLAHGERDAAPAATGLDAAPAGLAAGQPPPARLKAEFAGETIAPAELGIPLDDGELAPRLAVGAWAPARDQPGVFVSALEPGLVPEPTPRRGARPLAALDEVETEAQVLLVAFDLSRFELGFAVGTDHPRVGWSDRVPPGQFDETLPGPDGIGDITPLVPSGRVPFALADRTVATFTAGFKRSHGAFRTGPLAERNFGSHYGFVENGVVLSKLQPGLATVYVLDDGTVGMKTWIRADNALLERIAFARQNGVPIVESDPATGRSAPGELVARWADGNWSGSQDKKLRSVRAGICLQESAAGRFLLYGYFSSATPGAMARVFAAYGCGYAMSTDMNALEHTYLALYRAAGSRLEIDHLVAGHERARRGGPGPDPAPLPGLRRQPRFLLSDAPGSGRGDQKCRNGSLSRRGRAAFASPFWSWPAWPPSSPCCPAPSRGCPATAVRRAPSRLRPRPWPKTTGASWPSCARASSSPTASCRRSKPSSPGPPGWARAIRRSPATR